jgi:hypothetical protein
MSSKGEEQKVSILSQLVSKTVTPDSNLILLGKSYMLLLGHKGSGK